MYTSFYLVLHFSTHLIMNILLQVSWILYPRLVHCWKETNLPLLPWKSRPQKNVSKSLGKASYDVRSVIRLVKVAGMLAADYFSFGTRNQLDFGLGMTNTDWKKMILKKKKQHKRNAKNNNSLFLVNLIKFWLMYVRNL